MVLWIPAFPLLAKNIPGRKTAGDKKIFSLNLTRCLKHDLCYDGRADKCPYKGQDRDYNNRHALFLEIIQVFSYGDSGVGQNRRTKSHQIDLRDV